MYRCLDAGLISVYGGYNGNVVMQVAYTSLVNMCGAGVGSFASPEVTFWNGVSESNARHDYSDQVRIKFSASSTYPGTGVSVRLARKV